MKAKLRSNSQITKTLFAFFWFLLLLIILYVFYGEEVQSRLEEDLFDLRCQLKPQIADTSQIAVVTISQKDITVLEHQNAQVPSLQSIKRILEAVFVSQPKAVALILPHHDINYESPEFRDFTSVLKKHPNLYFGSFDLNFGIPSDSLVPSIFAAFPEQIYSAGTVRLYRREVVRSLPLLSYQNDHLAYHLMTKMALNYAKGKALQGLKQLTDQQIHQHTYQLAKLNLWDEPMVPRVTLNYLRPHMFLSLKASKLVEHKGDTRLAGRIVIIGYTAFRKRTFEYRDGTYVNTPWDGDGTPEVFGTPLVYVQAVKLHNLLQGLWLRLAPIEVNILQTLATSIVSFLIWKMAPFMATIVFCLLIFALLYGHALLFAFGSIHIPLADTLLFAIIATIIGAFLRAHYNSQQLVISERKALAKKKLAMIQSRFLNRFAFELFEFNDHIYHLLNRHSDDLSSINALKNVYLKAMGSSEELRDYLQGIKQYAHLTKNKTSKSHKTKVLLRPLIERILLQFEALIEEQKLVVKLSCAPTLCLWTDAIFLEPVLFNLISNAVKYSPHAGTVAIEAKASPRENIKIAVSDEGPGIAADYHDKIFEKFYRIKNDQHYHIKGNGLGLYLCRFFAEKIEARVYLRSQVGQGSCFILEFLKNPQLHGAKEASSA